MKVDPPPQTTAPVTLQTVLDRLAADPGLSGSRSRKRDLRCAIATFAKLTGQPATAIRLDLAEIRHTLDRMVPARAQISAKRWANLRSDLGAAIAASRLQPMLRTAGVELDSAWRGLLAHADQWKRHGLSRFARWATLRRIAPVVVDDSTIERFVAELEASTLVRNLRYRSRLVRRAWNASVAQHPANLQPVAVAANGRTLKRLPWHQLRASLRKDLRGYVAWAAVPDPLEEGARARALSRQTLRLQQEHVHSAVTAAVAAGIPVEQLTSLACLVEPETFRALLRHRWREDGCRLSAYTHGIAITLIAIASEWVKLSAETVATLKTLRGKLGALPPGLTEKNKTLLRRLDDPRLMTALVQLPDRLWHAVRPAKSHRSFVDLQTALAIDLLIHVPLRMQNLSKLEFDRHLHFPEGRRKPALITFNRDETKTKIELNYELPAALSDRLLVYRNEIGPAVIGRRPDVIFLTKTGRKRSQAAIANAIHRAILRYLGLRMSPHQFRHSCAKIILDCSPGAYELVRQMLGHASHKTTTSFYAGIDTRRAGRAHAELVMKLRESKLGRGRQGRAPQARED
jgi:integrase